MVYPEGTRSLLPEGLPLKLGAIASAYQLQWPVQVRSDQFFLKLHSSKLRWQWKNPPFGWYVAGKLGIFMDISLLWLCLLEGINVDYYP